jgi:hypothetical protein
MTSSSTVNHEQTLFFLLGFKSQGHFKVVVWQVIVTNKETIKFVSVIHEFI